MGVLDVLSRAAGVAGAGFQGYGEDQATGVKELLAKAKEAREAQSALILDKLHGREANQLRLGDEGYAGAMGAVAGSEASAKVPAAIEEARQLSPITTATAVNTARGVEPIHTAGAIATAQGESPIIERREARLKGVPTYADLNPNLSVQNTTNGLVGVNPKTAKTTALTDAAGNPLVKPVGTGTGGQVAPQMAAARANLESAMKIMDDFEAKLKRGEAHYGIGDATQGAVASSPTALTVNHLWDVPVSMMANAASSHLQSSNPELARYMTAKKFVAEAILNTHKRPNQTQYEIEQELSGIGPNPSEMQIDMGAQRRHRMYTEVFTNPAAGGVTGHGEIVEPTTKRSASDILAAHGIH